jgi:hypothetical protein
LSGAVIIEPGGRIGARDFMHQRDAVLDRAHERAHTAADAFSFVDTRRAAGRCARRLSG